MLHSIGEMESRGGKSARDKVAELTHPVSAATPAPANVEDMVPAGLKDPSPSSSGKGRGSRVNDLDSEHCSPAPANE